MFIRTRNEPYLPLPSQPQLVLIYRPRRDGRLSRPWCEIAQAEIPTRNLWIANPALCHTGTSARSQQAESQQYFAAALYSKMNDNERESNSGYYPHWMPQTQYIVETEYGYF